MHTGYSCATKQDFNTEAASKAFKGLSHQKTSTIVLCFLTYNCCILKYIHLKLNLINTYITNTQSKHYPCKYKI